MSTYFIADQDLTAFISSLQNDYTIYHPINRDGRYFMNRWGSPTPGSEHEYEIAGVRTVEPIKSFLFEARKRVSVNYGDTGPIKREPPLCIIGARACDLKGLQILDTVFQGEDFQDPFYIAAREETLIISADCTSALNECFCLALQVDPYPKTGYDINLSAIDSGYIAESGSEKGQKLIDAHIDPFLPAPSNGIEQRDEKRSEVGGMVQCNIDRERIPDINALNGVIRRNYESSLWKEEAERCVECGACNTICPTCHCFLLVDQMNEENLARFRIWDSCLIKDFAKVAGGANPREELWMRLRNRFEKKFDFFPEVNETYACTGCGRCISACPAEIDIRHVLTRNVEYVDEC